MQQIRRQQSGKGEKAIMVHYLCVLLEPGIVKQRSQKVSVGSEVYEGLFTCEPLLLAYLTFHPGIHSASEDRDLYIYLLSF